MNKKSVSPLITGLCCVAAVTAVSAYMDRSNDRSVSELAAVPSENTAYEIIISSEETVSETILSDAAEYISETEAESSETSHETSAVSSEASPETSVVSSETSHETAVISSESIAPETSSVSETQVETLPETESEAVSDNADIPSGDVHVILNTKTKCIHIDPDCQHAKKISDENRQEGYSDISALAELGYWACSKCAGDYRDIAPKP